MTRSVVIVTTILTAVLALAHRLDPVGEGLKAVYYADRDWSPSSAVATLLERPSSDRLIEAWQGAPPEMFSASWTGSLLAFRDAAYTFATISDDGSWVYVDGKLVVDNGGQHGPAEARGTTTLARGVHAIFIRYVQERGGLKFDLKYGRDGQPLAPVPGWALAPRAVKFWRFLLSAALRRTLAGAEWLWAGTLLVGAIAAVRPWASYVKRWLERKGAWPLLAWIVAGSCLLNVAGLWWGLPGGSWAPDELTPLTVLSAAGRGFSHGWYDRYPPFHFYVLTAAFSPLIAFQALGRIALLDEPTYTILAVVGRLVSVAAGAGTLAAVYACGARVFGSRAGLCAAAMFALVTPFVYYAKTANLDVPYVFWFSVSLLFYVRILDALRPVDFVAFAVCATLAVCTKDQAYGLYLLAPFVIVYRLWRVNHDAGASHPLIRALIDRRLAWAAALAGVLFAACHNLLFNWIGFVEHVRYITGGGSAGYREFAPSLAGRAALLWLTVDLVRVAWGWPLFLISLAGAYLAFANPRSRQAAIWLAVPIVSYYFGFINVVLYDYDRFVLPICVVMAVFGGVACDQWLPLHAPRHSPVARGPARRAWFGEPAWRIAGASAVLAYSVLYAATVDVAMIRDSRYKVEQWMAAHVGPDDLVGFVFPQQYYPRLEAFDNTEIRSIEQLRRERPMYYVLNADYARAVPLESPAGRLIAGLQGGTLGYEPVFQFRQPRPWPWLPGAHRDVVGPRTEKPITSALRHINPFYEVFERQTAH